MQIGILGGGQLGRMIIEAGQPLGHRFHVYDPGSAEPCQRFYPVHHRKKFDDRKALQNFADHCDKITLEFENVPCESAEFLSKTCPVCPSCRILKIAQNRFLEKSLAKKLNIGVADFIFIESQKDVIAFLKTHKKIVLKSNRSGYDGKGQQICETEKQVNEFYERHRKTELIAEKFIPFMRELSVIIARNQTGEIGVFPVSENIHHQGILTYSMAPANTLQENEIRRCAAEIAEKIDLCGLLAVEFFELPDGEILLNEMAPRPHNSGHYSMDACDCSQFLLLNHLLAGVPIISPKLKTPVIMINILGEYVEKFTYLFEKSLENFHFYFYEKSEIKPRRKMGHLNITGNSLEEIKKTIRKHELELLKL